MINLDLISFSCNLITVGTLLSMGLYHFVISRKRETQRKTYIYISYYLFSLIPAVFLMGNIYNLNEVIKSNYSFLLPIISITFGFISYYFVFMFALVFFDFKYNKLHKFLVITFFCMVLTAAFTNTVFKIDFYLTKIRPIIMIVLAITIFTTISNIVFLFFKFKKYHYLKNNIVISTVFLAGFVMAINQLAMYNSLLWFIKGNLIGLAIVAILNSLALAIDFNREHLYLIELKQNLEIKVEERTQEIKNLIEQKTNIFINLAHETKTPLTLLKNSIESYMRKVKPDDDLKILRQSIDKLVYDMVNYLDAEKLERGQIFYNHSQTFNFSEFFKNKISLYNNIAMEKRILLSSKSMSGIYIEADPAAIDRILNNLLDNAIRYTEKGSIVAELTKKDNKIIIGIKDTGIGILEEEQKNIFRPFHQASHDKRNIQGIGMGLYITKQIIDELKGEINVKSKINEGSVFTVVLPLYELKANDIITGNNPLTHPFVSVSNLKLEDLEYNPEKDNIFIVEDNIEMLSYIQNNLKERYNIFHAINGKEALQKLNLTPKPKLIVSDIMMDEMDGYQFYDELRAKVEYAAIPFIFLTAKTTSDAKLLGLEKGAIDYIFKPFSMKELTLKIEALLSLQVKKEKIYKEELKEKITKALDTESNTINTKFDTICRAHDITSREKEIIQLIKQGYSQKNIASNLNISLSTIKKHVDHIYKKCKVQTQIELINLFYD